MKAEIRLHPEELHHAGAVTGRTQTPPGSYDMRLPVAAAAILLIGATLRLSPFTHPLSNPFWLGGLVLTGAPLVWRTTVGMLRGHFASDVVASLAIAAALLIDEPFAGLVIVLMQSGGEALERYATGRASAAVRELEAGAPQVAHRVQGDGTIEDVRANAVEVEDVLLVRPHEQVPCDSEVTGGLSYVDTSRLTGEPIPLEASPGTRLPSGSMNGDGALTVRALATSFESQYERIVELVRSAQSMRAPLQRLADRYAVWFTPLTLIVCAVTWVVSRDPARVLAVLVVATPCPLILATPVAIIGGINRAARRQIIIRTGAAIEQLARATTGVFDKTGTLTVGEPRVSAIRTAPGFERDDVFELAGAVERDSSHLLARALEDAVAQAGVTPLRATAVTETAGRGVTGIVEGRRVTVGSESFVRERHPEARDAFSRMDRKGTRLAAHVAVDGRAAAIIHYADRIRLEARRLFADLARLGVKRIVLLSGDRESNAQAVARELGITEVRGDLSSADKLTIVDELLAAGERVMMVGDGTNDAPALSRANVGVGIVARGGGITAEASDVVILADDIGRVAEAVTIARRTLRIAKQSIVAGLGLSAIAMVAASLGYIPVVAGALLQEAIDIAVIVNALRTSAAPR